MHLSFYHWKVFNFFFSFLKFFFKDLWLGFSTYKMEIIMPDIHGQARGGCMVLPTLLFLSLISKRSSFTILTKVGLHLFAHVN